MLVLRSNSQWNIEVQLFLKGSLFSSAIVICLVLLSLTHSRLLMARVASKSALTQWVNNLEHKPEWDKNQKREFSTWLHHLPDPLKHHLVNHERNLSLIFDPSLSLYEWQSTLIDHLLARYYEQQRVAKDKQWHNLSGWHRANLASVLLGRAWRAHNQDPRGYADGSGMLSPKADFISTGRHFFLPQSTSVESSLKCRLPRKYRYFQQQFPDYPDYWQHPAIQCDTIDNGFLRDLRFLDPITGQAIDLGLINASTVREFELLYATPGVGDPAEIAGHLVLRLLLDNNPQAEALGIDNPNDLVISFLADTKQIETAPTNDRPVVMSESCEKSWFGLDLNTEQDWDAFASVGQAVKGLTGGFLTVMDRQTLAQAVQHYTVFQDRNLLRFRLNLTQRQKESLLNRLYEAKKNYNGRYYFFKENCGSVLFRVIGEGIGSELMTGFDPLVTPPNAFISRMLQAGLVTPIQPSFLSYRRRAYLAQEEFLAQYQSIQSSAPNLPWPSHRHLFSAREKKRYQAYQRLAELFQTHFKGDPRIYHLLNLALSAEEAHANHDLLCKQMTSKPATVLTEMQRELIGQGVFRSAQFAPTLNNRRQRPVSDLTYSDILKQAHTGLQSYELGVALKAEGDDHQYPVITLFVQLYQQQIADRALFAMGNGTAVDFGRVSLELDQASGELSDWSFTGLKIRKFKDRLNRIPNLGDPGYQLGLGLTVLETEKVAPLQGVLTQWIAGELLANLWSSIGTDRFLFASLGVALESDWRGLAQDGVTLEDNHTRVALPIGVEAAWTFDAARRWQLRASAVETWRWGERQTEGLRQLKLNLSHHLGRWGQQAIDLDLMYETTSFLFSHRHQQQLAGFTLSFRPF
ncbi:MAG TPA: hypothetical protein DCZ03_04630 [Gammaproteobacteria bacterium]|nr:hypothetical protein [Gammaproteobacteria bacterium]